MDIKLKQRKYNGFFHMLKKTIQEINRNIEYASLVNACLI